MKWRVGAATALLSLPVVCSAQNVPVPGPGEERAAALVMQAQDKLVNDLEAAYPLLEEALTLAPNPTPFRGMIECMRGTSMRDRPDLDARAREAFAECVRLLPDNITAKTSYAAFLLFHDLKNDGDLRQGTDLLLEVMEQDARAARGIPSSLFTALLRRLGYLREDGRIARVMAALLKQDFLSSSAEDYDPLILRGIVAALNEANFTLAKQLVPMLKRSKSLDALSTSLAAKPIWQSVADYRKGGLAYRLADYDRSTKIALAAEPIGGLPARISALGEENRPDEIYALITDQIKQASAGKRLEGLEDAVSAAARELASAGMVDKALGVRTVYLDALDEDQFQSALNLAFTQGFRLIEYGHRKEGLAVLEKALRTYWRDTSATEGKGGELNALALASCDTTSRQANIGFAQLASQKAINPSAYEIALRCRNDIPALAVHIVSVIGGNLTYEGLSGTAELRRIEAGLTKDESLTDHALLLRTDVRAALDRVSVPLEKRAIQ